MANLLRTVRSAVALSLALAGVTGCSAADRAVMTAPPCPDSSASPSPETRAPGQAVLMGSVVRGSLPPGPIEGWEEVISVADARNAIAAVHPDGTVSVVGVDHLGVLGGVGAGAPEVLRPQKVPGVNDVTSVEAVGSTFLATRSDGSVVAWGDGFIASGGEKGGSRAQPTPALVPRVEKVIGVAYGQLNALALRSDGKIQAWGTNLTRILGEPDGTEVRTIRGLPGAVSVANPGGAGIIATGSGDVCAWGNNVHGLLGVEPRGGQTTRAVKVDGLTDIVQVAAGSRYALARDTEGRVWAWGRSVYGILGDGNTEDFSISTPRQVVGVPPMRWIGASSASSYGIDQTGGLWAWGSNRRVEPYASQDRLPYRIPLPGPAQEVSGEVVLLEPAG
ncbi:MULTISPECIES: RCC1 domain-containing protein [unclassified Dietzia]|uniref:RCC1 domain-containing protein n=1 Tax=unclassified Dietzia TaxID=2617939 RepID=UPI0015FB25A4|nr:MULTISPECIES: RCC1 repeat domain-containing protein [unclassified Dietzia]MBB1024286.1 RCC1 repeat domain-containing protein [Dietzia sp. DQ12-76]MBB1029111.1 RCC1 repeat domain-containing protein [Dietzia sp. DQ11-38-2]